MSNLEKRRDSRAATPRDLEQRVVAALKGDDKITSAEIEALIAEVEEAIVTAEADAEAAMTAAYDPVMAPDADKARDALQGAELAVKRLRTLLIRLGHGYHDVQRHEWIERWLPRHEATEQARDQTAAEFEEIYLGFTGKLVPLLEKMRDVDRKCREVNDSSPGGLNKYLVGVEEKARGHGRSLLEELFLPGWEIGSAPLWRGRAR